MKHKTKKRVPLFVQLSLALILLASTVTTGLVIRANNQTVISYQFTGEEASMAGYAEGSLSLYAKEAGTYYLYWANDTKALDGYYAIGDIDDTTNNDSSTDITKKQAYFHDMSAGESRTFTFEDHTAIPAGATKIIATTSKTSLMVCDAEAVFDIPEEKQLQSGAGNLLYTFNSYSDIHIDTEAYYQKSKTNWQKALKFASDKNTDFIVSAGDAVTNSKGDSGSNGGFADEWDTYQKILAASDYCNPVYECDGNHDMRTESKGKLGSGDTYKGVTAFVQASGTDSTVANVEANKPYYYVIEKTSGDVFIFMALENGSDPGNYDNFSEEQINWLKDLLDTYYGTGVNVYIIEHSPFRGYGAGDAWMTPKSNGYIPSHYKSHMLVNGQTGKDDSGNYFTASGMDQNTEFRNLLEKYPNLIWMNGHTHQDFTVCVNYSNQNDTSCHMIHNPGVVGTTYFTDANSESQEYDKTTSSSDGYGRTSQGYYVETYENAVVYYGANLYDQKIYPAYCYIMEGSRNAASIVTSETRTVRTPIYEHLIADKELITMDTDLSSALTVAKSLLDKYYTLSSYNQYQALKKYYYAYKDNALLSDTSYAVANLKEASEQLYALAKKLGKTESDNSTATNCYLVYYVENKHAWTDNDCKLTTDANGNLSYTYTATGSETASFKIYNKDTNKYCAVSESVELTCPFSSATYSLSEFDSYSSTSGARSITLKGLSNGTKVTFTYNATLNSVSVSCKVITATPDVTPSVMPVTTPAITTTEPTFTVSPTAPSTIIPTETAKVTPTETAIVPTQTTSVTTTAPNKETNAPTTVPTVTPTKVAPTAVPTKEASTATPAPTPIAVPSNTAAPVNTSIKKGSVYSHTASNGTYRVLKINKTAAKDGIIGTVAFVKPIKKTKTTATIPATVTIKKCKFKVTTIAKNAFANNKKLKKVVIRKNITKINANAFKGCKKLSKITIQTTGLTKKSIGKNAFKGIRAKATIQVPSKKLKLYKKYVKAAGAAKTVVFKKLK